MDAGCSLENVPIDRGWAWMALLGAAVSSFFFVGGIRSLGILLVEVVTRFSATSAEASMILAIVSIGVAVVAPLSSAIGERFTFRLVIMAGGVFCSLGCFLTGFATNTTFVVLAYGTLTGVGFACIAGPSLIVVGHYFNKRRALANGLAVSGGSVGQLVIPLLMRYLLDEYSFMGGLMIYSAISLHVVAAAMLMRPFSYYSPKRKMTQKSNSHQACTNTGDIPTGDKNQEVSYRPVIEKDICSTSREAFQMLRREDSNVIDGEAVELTDLQMLESNGQVPLSNSHTNIPVNPLVENGHATVSKKIPVNAELRYNQHSIKQLEQSGFSSDATQHNEDLKLDPLSVTKGKSLSIEDIQGLVPTLMVTNPEEEQYEDTMVESESDMISSSDFLNIDQNSNFNPLNSCPKMRNPGQQCRRTKRQTSTLSWVSVRSLEVAPHQEIPEVPVSEQQQYGVKCPQDFLVNFCCCLPSTPSVSNPIIPWYMFKDPLFILYIVGMCLGNSGFMNAGLFFPAHAEYDVGLTRSTATWLLSIMGLVDLVGRIGGGWFADLGYISRSRILAGCLLITGMSTFICIPFLSYTALTGLSIVMGLVGGCCVSMQTVVLVDFFGAEKLSATCGLSIMCQGLTNIFVPSLLGIVRDCTGSYTLSYYICATLMIIAGILFNLETCVRARRKVK